MTTPEYKLADFLEEIRTVLWEKGVVLEKAQNKSNEPVAGLTQIRINRLRALEIYLKAIAAYQASKADDGKADDGKKFDFDKLKRPATKVDEKPAPEEKTVQPRPEPQQTKAAVVEEPVDDWDD